MSKVDLIDSLSDIKQQIIYFQETEMYEHSRSLTDDEFYDVMKLTQAAYDSLVEAKDYLKDRLGDD